MTIEEYKVKCAILRSACPPIDPHILLFETGWELLGYAQETADEPLIHVKHRSYAQAEREYREAYRRLVAGGRIKPPCRQDQFDAQTSGG